MTVPPEATDPDEAERVVRQRLVAVKGMWQCAWCAAGIFNGIIGHLPTCRFITDLQDHGAAAERDRIRRDLFGGDPGRLEVALRGAVWPEEAADCAGIIADLLREEP